MTQPSSRRGTLRPSRGARRSVDRSRDPATGGIGLPCRPLEDAADRHALLHADFRWHVPQAFNIAEVCSRRWARSAPAAVAIRWQHEDGRRAVFTYGDLQRAADRLSRALRRLGVARGDRVAIVMPQRFETAVAHMAVYQLGAVAMPLSMLFGPEALAYRLSHS